MLSKGFFALVVVCSSVPCMGQAASGGVAKVIEPAGAGRPANANGEYQALRGDMPAGEGVRVQDFALQREGASLHFESGTFYFYKAVRGKITGAVFVGKGRFGLTAKSASEQRSLALLTKGGPMSEDFTNIVLRFTDATAEEIRKASVGSGGPTPSQATDAAAQMQKMFRMRLHQNLDLRLLEDVLKGSETDHGQYFLASFRMGGALAGKSVLFTIDPEGTANSSPDQVELATLDGDYPQTWVAYRMESAGAEMAGLAVHVTGEDLDMAFDRSAKMTGSAMTTMQAQRDGLQVVRLDLYPTLRVSGVYSEDGRPLDYVQEGKDADPAFAAILPKAVKRGETVRLLTRYAGSDALKHEGDGVYYLEGYARENWYPSGREGFGNFIPFHMTFHVPKGLEIVATGHEISRKAEGDGMQRVVWESGTPIPVAGFSLGDFKSAKDKTPQGFDVSAYANVALPDDLAALARRLDSGNYAVAVGSMSTVPMLKTEVSQGTAAVQIYSNYFGKLPYDHVALTEQSACNYGQSWPMLVYLPVCAFWDSTIQQQLGLRAFGGEVFWEEVTPHEVAHQWWGHLVGFESYRDQWMSEGFAQFSAGLYLLNTSPKMDAYREFWATQRRAILERNKEGFRPIDVGPLTMGYRVANSKSGYDVYRLLIYGKGAYVLHMLEMMYWTPKYGEAPFKKSMQAFTSEYAGKAATTEDFKASLEKSMPEWMDVHHDRKLDWFFNEYVYGTELPHYEMTSDFKVENGETTAHFKLTQSNVSKDFVMLMPVYLQMADGSTTRVFNLELHGNTVSEHTVKLGKLPTAPKKMLINFNADVLSD